LEDLLVHVRDHLALAVSALLAALAVALPLGTLLARSPRLRTVGLGAVGVARVIPSLAILAFALPVLGIGARPTLAALALLAIPPLVIGIEGGLAAVPAETLEAARGLGLSERQQMRRVAWPLALPVFFAGLRTATVEVIASATLAAFVGGGGLGEYLLEGLATNDVPTLLKGALAVAGLALAADTLLGLAERRATTRVRAAESGTA